MATQGRAAGSNLTSVIAKVKKDLGDIQKVFLLNLVEDIVEDSPVYSGTYVRGHNIESGNTSAGGQFTGPFVSSPKSENPDAEKDIARAKLRQQIQNLPENIGVISINNRVPHASKVEYTGWPGKGPYSVYSKALNNSKIYISEAVQQVKARQ